jgi:PAS domain S-box-containing protein
MPTAPALPEDPSAELENLRRRLEEAEDTLLAIRSGQVDAVVVSSPSGERVFVLKGAEQPYRVFVETMNEGAVTMLPDCAIIYCNHRFAEMVQKPLEQVIGARFEEFVALEQHAQIRPFLALGLVETCRAEFPLHSGNGSIVWAELSLSPVALEDCTGICLVARDITGSKRAEAEIRRLNTELEERVRQRTLELEAANRELEAFCYSVSHDLRAPLRAISSYSAIILDDFAGQLPSEARRLFDRVHCRAQEMGKLITSLLTFSRLGRQQINKQSVSPTELVRRALATLSAEQQDRRVEIVVLELPECLADPVLLEQLFVNLLSNALKFTRGREPARIEVGAAPVSALASGEASPDAGPEDLAYFVRDNGAGFDMRYADKLFGVFQRLHAASEYEGTGVGLSIVQRIVQRHGGRVWAHAAVDRGATFYFTLGGAPRPATPSETVLDEHAALRSCP